MAFYIPSHDMIVSILAETRYDASGLVRVRSFEVLPTQIYVAGESTQDNVKSAATVVMAASALRYICAAYTFFLVCLKIRYRAVVGTRTVATSVIIDFIQIALTVFPVIYGGSN